MITKLLLNPYLQRGNNHYGPKLKPIEVPVNMFLSFFLYFGNDFVICQRKAWSRATNVVEQCSGIGFVQGAGRASRWHGCCRIYNHDGHGTCADS